MLSAATASAAMVAGAQAGATTTGLWFLEQDPGFAGGRGLKTFPVAVGPAVVDRGAIDFVQHLHQLRLPRSWSELPTSEEIVRDEVNALLEQHGPDAAGLRETYIVGRKEPIFELTSEAVRQLRVKHGERGFLVRNPRGQPALYRCIPDPKGNLLEIWLTHPTALDNLERRPGSLIAN